MQIRELETVALTADVSECGLKCGDTGVVVHAYSPEDFEVEFQTVAGQTRAVVTLNQTQIRALSPTDMPSARPTDAA
jgi:hypothetical protein